MAFIVDGSEWCFDDWSAAAIDEALGILFERIRVARSRGERVWIEDDLQNRPVLGALSVWELWSPDCPVRLPLELHQELAAALGTVYRYLDENDWPPGMEDAQVRIEQEPIEENSGMGWAHHNVRAGRAVVCLGLQRSGVFPTHSASGSADVHWVTDEQGHRKFFRAAISVEHDNEETIQRLAPHAYPDVFFLEQVWRGLSDFKGGYAAVRRELQRHLALYDDHGRWIFTAPPPSETEEDSRQAPGQTPDQRLIQRRFELRGLDVAPEKPDVASDRSSRQARERQLNGTTLYCHWHGKIELHINRIHIHSPVPESDGKLIVAIFHAHLPLPGKR